MTNQLFEPEQFISTGVNLYGSAIATSAQERFEPATFTDITNLLRNAGMALDRDVRVTAIRITDLRNGWGQSDDQIKTSASTAWQAYRRRMLLPPKISTTTLASSSSVPPYIMGWCHFGPTKQLVMTIGGTANACIAKETSSTDATPVFITYDPGVGIATQGCAPIIIGGATTAEQVAIFKNTAATQVFSDLTPTSSGSMHANTASTWAIFTSNINATTPGTGTLLIYAGNSIYALAQTAALAAAPTQTLTNIPAGGAPLMGSSGGGGVEALQKNWQNRAYMWWPSQSYTASAIYEGTDYFGDVVSINLEGTGPELIPSTLIHGSRTAALWNRTVVQSDGTRIVSYDGETERDLHFLKGRASNSDYRWGCTDLIVNGADLYALVQREDLTVSTVTLGATILRLELYLPELDAWVPVTGNFTLDTLTGYTSRTAINGLIGNTHNRYTSLPMSKQTGFIHVLMRSTVWNRTWLPPEGVDPFLHYNQTGSSANIAQQWATSAQWTSDKFPIRGLPPGTKHVWLGCSAAEMDLAAGGVGPTAANVAMSCAIQDGTSHTFTGAKSETFTASDPLDKLTRWWMDNTSDFTIGQVRLDLTQDTSVTYKTPNALPATFYVMSFLTGKVRAPYQAGFEPFDHVEGASW